MKIILIAIVSFGIGTYYGQNFRVPFTKPETVAKMATPAFRYSNPLNEKAWRAAK